MNKAFEKILEKLDAKKQYFQKFYEADGKTEEDEYINKATQLAFDDAKNIVQEVAEEYNNGWIAISDRFPENDKYILLSFDNFSVPMIGRYESYESGGAFYIGDEDITCSKQDLFVNAWQPLPEPYQPKGE